MAGGFSQACPILGTACHAGYPTPYVSLDPGYAGSLETFRPWVRGCTPPSPPWQSDLSRAIYANLAEGTRSLARASFQIVHLNKVLQFVTKFTGTLNQIISISFQNIVSTC
jgi:hypothetical protein